MTRESPEDDPMEEQTFPCPHCGFVLQKKWQQERCPWCKREIPPNAEKLGQKIREEKAKKRVANAPQEIKPEIHPIKETNTNQMEEEKKKISPKIQEILNQPIEEFKEIQASEKIYDPSPPEQADFVNQWGFDPIKNKIPLAGGYFYTGESVYLENSKREVKTFRARPYIYAYRFPFGEEKHPSTSYIFRYIIVEQGDKQIPIPCSLDLLVFFNQILKIDDTYNDIYTPWRQLVILREILKKLVIWDVWGEQFPLDWIPRVRKYYGRIQREFISFYTQYVNAINHLINPTGFNPQELFFYHREDEVIFAGLVTQPKKVEHILTIDTSPHIFEGWHPEKLYQFENCLVNTPLLSHIVENSDGSVLYERIGNGEIVEAVHLLTYYPEPQYWPREELMEKVEDLINKEKGYEWEGDLSEFWNRYHSNVWHILAVNTNTTSFDRRLLGLSTTCKNLRVQKKFYLGEDLARIALSYDGMQIFGGFRDGIIKAWSATTGKEEKRFSGHRRAVTALFATPDGKYLFSGSEDGELRRWDMSTGECLQVIVKNEDVINEMALTSDGNNIITLSEKGIIKCWEPETGKLLVTIMLPEQATQKEDRLETASPIARPQITSDGCGVLYVMRGNIVGLFDFTEKKVIKSYHIFSAEICLAISRDGKYFVTGGDEGDLKMVSIDGDEKVREINGPPDWILTGALFLGTNYFICGCRNVNGQGIIRIWETQTGLPVEMPLFLTGAIDKILVDPKETYFCYNGSSTLKVYSIEEYVAKKPQI